MTDSSPPSPRAQLEQLSSALVRSLCALPELGFRIAWLRERTTSESLQELAPAFEEILRRSLGADEPARTATVPIGILLSQLHDSALLFALHQVALAEHLTTLAQLTQPISDEGPLEENFETKVEDPRSGRDLSVGERRSMARRPSRPQIDRLLFDPHPLVLELLFDCPNITEEDILRVVSKRPARVSALKLVLERPRWMARARIRAALILNPGCPQGAALPLLATLKREELSLIIQQTSCSDRIRQSALYLRAKIPPARTPHSALH